MDTQKQSHPLNNSSAIPTAQLWIGQHEYVLQEVQLFLQKILCPHTGCQICATCMKIRNKQHHAIKWFLPEKSYTIDQLEDLFTTIAYTLQPDEKFFFIIQKADTLSTTCANKLLKPMEEPPQGYHFILLAEHIENILPTIISRCITHKIATRNDNFSHHYVFLSLTTQPCSIVEFSKIIDTVNLTEKESMELCNEIMHYWIKETKKELLNNESSNKSSAIVTALKRIYSQPLMPGSTTLFWRTIYFGIAHLIR